MPLCTLCSNTQQELNNRLVECAAQSFRKKAVLERERRRVDARLRLRETLSCSGVRAASVLAGERAPRASAWAVEIADWRPLFSSRIERPECREKRRCTGLKAVVRVHIMVEYTEHKGILLTVRNNVPVPGHAAAVTPINSSLNHSAVSPADRFACPSHPDLWYRGLSAARGLPRWV